MMKINPLLLNFSNISQNLCCEQLDIMQLALGRSVMVFQLHNLHTSCTFLAYCTMRLLSSRSGDITLLGVLFLNPMFSMPTIFLFNSGHREAQTNPPILFVMLMRPIFRNYMAQVEHKIHPLLGGKMSHLTTEAIIKYVLVYGSLLAQFTSIVTTCIQVCQ